MLLLLLLLLGAVPAAVSQRPTADWQPNFTPLGLFCSKTAQNVNVPASSQHDFPHSGGCGCENTQFRWTDGQLYMMESHGHDCDPMFEGYNTTVEGDCTYFRIRHMLSGRIIANVSESLRHSFFSAVVDYDAKPSAKLWVFGPAHARGNKKRPGPCDGNGDWSGCYIGSWSSTDLTTFSHVSKAVPIPDHHAAFNTRTTMVARLNPAAAAVLPKHQAAMVLEPRSDHAFMNGTFRYAINIGSDGDLSKNWQLLPGHQFSESGPTVPKQLNLGAPTMHYDAEEGYYYTIGGGSITAGPVRSKTLATGSWELTARAPMSVNAADLSKVGLPPTDATVYKGFYKEVWARETAVDKAYIDSFLSNITEWNWGHTDPDFCCADGKAPSYMLHTVSQQGMPSNQSDRRTTQFAGMEMYNGTLNAWLRSYFLKTDDVLAVRAAQGRLSALSVFRCKSVFVWGFCMGVQGA
jgi:hypothetical protein